MESTKNQSVCGFTLIEILVVMAILAMSISIIPPLFSNSIDHARVKSTNWHIISDLQSARSRAIRNNKVTKVTFDVSTRQYNDDKYSYILNLPKESALSVISSDSEQIDNSKANIRFYPDGSSSGGQIKTSYIDKQYVIDINWLTGKVSFYD